VSILFSLNNIATLDSFKKVLLGYKFNYESFTCFVASWGNFETIRWFHSNGHCAIFPDDLYVLPNIAKKGDKETLMKYFQLYKDDNYYEYEVAARRALEVAAQYGQVSILQAADSLKEDFNWKDEFEELLESAVIGGQVEVLQWIWKKLSRKLKRKYNDDVGFFYNLIEMAVKAKHIDVMEWLSSSFQWSEASDEEKDDTDGIMIEAALNGNINTVRWLSSKNIIDNESSCTVAAVRGDNLEVLKYVIELGCPWSKNVCIIAASNGNLEILKWAVLNGCPFDASMMFPVAANCKRPNRDLYQWLLEQRCPFVEEKSVHNACKHGNFEFIVFIQSNNGSFKYDKFFNEIMIQGAIITGRLEALQWAMDQPDDFQEDLALDTKVPWSVKKIIDPSLMYIWITQAAKHRHLHILEFFRKTFPSEIWLPAHKVRELVENLAKWGHVNILDWVVKYKPDDWNKSSVFNAAIKYQKLKVLIWLKSQSTNTSENWYGTISDTFVHPSDLAIEVGNFEIFKWIHINGCPWNKNTDWLKLLTSDRTNCKFVEVAFEIGGVLTNNSNIVWNKLLEVQFRLNRPVKTRLWNTIV
jgi:hypothetical protein